MTAAGVVVSVALLAVLFVRELARVGALDARTMPWRLAYTLTVPLLVAFVLIAGIRLAQLS